VQVTETFNKIGMPNTSMMGLETLYNLLEENPSFPVEDLLSRTSEPFRQYISKGLHKVRLCSNFMSACCSVCWVHPGRRNAIAIVLIMTQSLGSEMQSKRTLKKCVVELRCVVGAQEEGQDASSGTWQAASATSNCSRSQLPLSWQP
jgi:hypothetical protein